MCPQFVDFDADGYTDIITATFEGVPFIVKGGAAGWSTPEYIKDAQGRNLVLSLYWDMEASKYENAERSPEGASNPKDHCVSAMAMDWDQDGDFDMLLGAYEGRLYLQRNEGTPGNPSFTGVNELLQAGGKDFMVEGGLTAPRAVDWDRDGLTDLVCGGFKGGVYLYRNAGTATEPAFEAPVTLIAKNELSTADAKAPNSGVYADPVDYDGDGDLDLLVGGYAEWEPEPRELTAEETARLAALDAEMEEIQAKQMAILEGVQEELEAAEGQEAQQAIYERIFGTEEMTAMQERMGVVFGEISVLRAERQREAGVWLYRRK